MKIAIGCDHAGFELKDVVAAKLKDEGYEVIDCGTNSTEPVDYPIFAHAAGKAVAAGEADRGIVVCGSGIGISIAANKVPGIRCALCTSAEMAEMSRRHNDANMLAMGARMISRQTAFDIVDRWLATEFEGGRHQRRVDMIEEIQQG